MCYSTYSRGYNKTRIQTSCISQACLRYLKMRASITLAMFTMLIGLVNCQTLNVGRCPKVDVKKDFDLKKVISNIN